MKILVLGGTVFLGRHIIEQALAAGHEVTMFNRGQSNPGLFDGQVEKVTGDRGSDLGKLAGRHFDACIDPGGYLPLDLEIAGRTLCDQVDRYVFISSISVYSSPDRENIDESADLEPLPADVDPNTFDVQYYGALKALCEKAIEREMPSRVLHVRSGLIVGPHDPSNRFTYWPVRVARGGDLIAPEPDLPVQIIHAADQARWILHMLERDQMGYFNVTSDNGTYTLRDVIEASVEVTGASVNPVYVSSEFLLEQGVGPWMELPLWLPEEHINTSRVSARKAVDSGMELMPLPEVVRSTLDWFNNEPARDWPAGLSPEKEAALLAAVR